MTDHRVASREEWQAAREGLLRREKEHTRIGDELAQERRELPLHVRAQLRGRLRDLLVSGRWLQRLPTRRINKR
jgi:predicted dithiol-disulfide oxidoreductase (DUF899 family)